VIGGREVVLPVHQFLLTTGEELNAMILLRALKWLIGYLVRFWICAFTKGLPAAFAMGYGEGELWASAMRRKYGVQGGDSTGQREVIEPDLCEEEEDSEDDRPGLELLLSR
jgi:hypothetical protein